jgi:hypothetical protein
MQFFIERNDKIEEIHRIDVELITEAYVRLKLTQIRFWSDLPEHAQDS